MVRRLVTVCEAPGGIIVTLEIVKNMKVLRALAMTAALFMCQPAWSSESNPHGPSGIDMTADLLIGRPVSFTIMLVGGVIWVAGLPFSALGGNVKATADALVVGPAKATFVRCLGCSSNAYKGTR